VLSWVNLLRYFLSCMSINKLSHLKEWEKIYLEVTREISTSDDSMGLMFCWTSSFTTFVNDDDTFYTLDDLKQLANDNMPKQGEMIDVRHNDWDYISWQKFVCLYEWKVIIERAWWLFRYDEWRFPKQKVEMTRTQFKEKYGEDYDNILIKE